MKKLSVKFIGADDGYTEVAGGNQFEKWDFKVHPEGEFVLMERKTLPQKAPATGSYDLYTVIEKNTKKPYSFFCGKVLEDKLKNIPLYSLVKIKFEGVHPQKRYHIYKAFTNANFRYDPAQFSLDNYVESKPEDGAQTTATSATKPSGFQAPKAKQVEEDLPF